MSLTTDKNDSDLEYGVDDKPVEQNKKYLVLSDEELAKGFVKPYRDSYRHVGKVPKYPLKKLTEEEKQRYEKYDYIAFEIYPESKSPATGRFWTQKEFDNNGCNTVTTMVNPIAETYARDPWFYGATYCVHCRMHKPLEEFIWEPDGESMIPGEWSEDEIKRVMELKNKTT